VLDLVVQAAHEVVHEDTSANVATGENLASKEVNFHTRSNLGHALVVGGKRRTHIHTKKRHVNDKKYRGPNSKRKRNNF